MAPPALREAPPEPGEAGVRAAALPLVKYGSDVGIQIGGAAYLYEVDRRGERQDWAALGVTWATRGPRSIETKGEALHLLGTGLRTFVQLKLAIDPDAPYWGEGAALGAGASPGAGAPPAGYRYQADGPWLSAILRGPILGRLDWWTRFRYSHVGVASAPPLLVASAPPGVAGGSSALGHLGVVVDTHEGGASPRSGFIADASVFAAPARVSNFRFGGVDLGARAYVPVAARSVLAVRGLYDLKLGTVPFFERALYEGIAYGEGLGGSGTIRGLARDRLMGEEKALVSAELRTWVVDTRWLGRPQSWGFSVGADAGRARDEGHAPVLGVGGFAGARLLWDHAVVLRLELGYAGQGATAVYLAFDEAF